MSLVSETLALALCMAILSALPLFSARLRSYSRPLFLAGTGAMFGICLFDLVPDVFELGGRFSIYVMGTVWLAYSLVHSLSFFHHEHDPETASGDCEFTSPSGFHFFFAPLVAHGFASGMLLAVAQGPGFPRDMAGSVFAALFAHKAYESLLLASILVGINRPRTWKFSMIGIYALALPLGVGVAWGLSDSISRDAAVIISSVAVGTLLGCLVFDFLIPSFRQLQSRASSLGWIAAGFILTRLIMSRH